MKNRTYADTFVAYTGELQANGHGTREAAKQAVQRMIEDVLRSTLFDFEGYGEACDVLHMLEVDFVGMTDTEEEIATGERIERMARDEAGKLAAELLTGVAEAHATLASQADRLTM